MASPSLAVAARCRPGTRRARQQAAGAALTPSYAMCVNVGAERVWQRERGRRGRGGQPRRRPPAHMPGRAAAGRRVPREPPHKRVCVERVRVWVCISVRVWRCVGVKRPSCRGAMTRHAQTRTCGGGGGVPPFFNAAQQCLHACLFVNTSNTDWIGEECGCGVGGQRRRPLPRRARGAEAMKEGGSCCCCCATQRGCVCVCGCEDRATLRFLFFRVCVSAYEVCACECVGCEKAAGRGGGKSNWRAAPRCGGGGGGATGWW